LYVLYSFSLHSHPTKSLVVADNFKKAFEDAQKSNAELSPKPAPPDESEPAPAEAKEEEEAETEETKEEAKEETKE
jgi:Ran-binding protein 1